MTENELKYRAIIAELSIKLAHERLPSAYGETILNAAVQIAGDFYERDGLPPPSVLNESTPEEPKR